MPVWRSASSHAWRISSSRISCIGGGSVLALGSSWLVTMVLQRARRGGSLDRCFGRLDHRCRRSALRSGNVLRVGGGVLRQPSKPTDSVFAGSPTQHVKEDEDALRAE